MAEKLYEYLQEHPCVDCGEVDPIVLEFDHQGDKKFNVSYMVKRGMGWTNILSEINKCQVRCRNCHIRKTAKDFGWYKHSRSL